MKSPFPGMDPYLETRWGDVHVRLCSMISAALQLRLPPGLRARSEEEVIVEREAGDARQIFRPDAVVLQTTGISSPAASEPRTAVIEEIELDFSLLETNDRWVQIIDTTSGNRVVTAIEILSPSNKAAGKANQRYRKKLEIYAEAGVNFVEIDLLRSSRSHLLVTENFFPPGKLTSYAVCVWRAARPAKISLMPVSLRSPLPTIPIPCRETDPEVPLALQPLIDQIYIDGGHDDIDYGKPLREPLSEEDGKWAAALVPARP